MRVESVSVYITDDGQEFPTETMAVAHEARLASKEMIASFLSSQSDVKDRFKNTLGIYLAKYEEFRALMQPQ